MWYIPEAPIFRELYLKIQSAGKHAGQNSVPPSFPPCSFSHSLMPYSTPGSGILIRCFHTCTIPLIQRTVIPFSKAPTFRNFNCSYSCIIPPSLVAPRIVILIHSGTLFFSDIHSARRFSPSDSGGVARSLELSFLSSKARPVK